jgi:hypothetical protein
LLVDHQVVSQLKDSYYDVLSVNDEDIVAVDKMMVLEVVKLLMYVIDQ